jgi:hypothetical protein
MAQSIGIWHQLRFQPRDGSASRDVIQQIRSVVSTTTGGLCVAACMLPTLVTKEEARRSKRNLESGLWLDWPVDESVLRNLVCGVRCPWIGHDQVQQPVGAEGTAESPPHGKHIPLPATLLNPPSWG